MDQNVKNFLLLNFGILLVLGFYYLSGRRRKPVSRLHLGRRDSSQSSPGVVAKGEVSDDKRGTIEFMTSETAGTEKVLNVIFTYNAHTWDAYEVFGLPAGSSMQAVTKAYEQALSEVDESSRGFVDAAYKAIQSKTQ